MIAEAGLAALWLAAALAALQLAMGWMGVSSQRTDLLAAVRPIAIIQAGLTGIAFLVLIYLFVTVDLSVALVAANDASTKPLLYKFAGTWGNHEGSMLMWVTILAVAGGAVAIFERRLDERTLIATLAAQAAIGLGFYAFLLFASNPFARLDPAPAEGQGLNPLLQDPGLAFHPPTLYLGYVGLSVAFSFAVGALVTRDVGTAFARAMRPWVLGAWILLTIGITAGSYWAYYELGWGGWWFWDPVENASLMPWLAATALLHSVTVLATREGLRAWTVMLAVVAFSMSMVGTFLVRSGILTSVHAFAVDPERGTFILALLAIYIGGALALFGLRVGTVREGSRFDAVSREGSLVINNLLLSAILGIVLVGTLYPLIAESITGEKLSVGPPYFNSAAGPLALILVMVMAAGPIMRWRRDDLKATLTRLAIPLLLSALVLLLVILLAPGIRILPLLGLVAAAGVGLASLAPLWGRNLRRTPLYIWGMVIAHLGIAVSMAGMASESAFTKETLVAARIGEPHRVGPYSVRLDDVQPVAGPNYTAIEGTVTAQRGDGKPFTLHPQTRNFPSPQTETNEAAITTVPDGQLYVVVGRADEQGRWQLRLWWKPFVTLIWAGGGLVALGGFLSLIGRVRREMRHAPPREFL
ncbi:MULTISPECIES: heme lyase CcmF/NrfE family subunit [Sphingomonadales]|uniref:Cytochrome c assembly protein n=1 Tax=Rhizorhabdus wittichii (strain DSM 6014 / CCUG 31198 / JCM 15750 / NBRC 105917 / EY 4224 / RW1) TaxID=392499 RepID=A0A9J9HEL9_RHIWR|nr:cytochrome c assembly protein [Rhizorhabdus wittichii RW1]ARR52713.1 c-type cytochrome biogenesis protein CcmF [Rhizorhabdus wittichii DC-6]